MDVLKRQTDFNDIKPYTDAEVPKVLRRLVRDPRLLDVLLRQRFPRWPNWLLNLLHPLTSWRLRRAIAGVHSKHEFQVKFIAAAIDRMLLSTKTKFSYSGLENLNPKASYLFVSNHRDIAMDPAFANYALYLDGYTLAQIGFGDNLIQEQFATDLIRINGGFKVERSAASMKDRVRAARLLSVYIKNTLRSGESIWLAQSEGRAKNGVDRTEASLFTMFYIAWRREMDFGFAMQKMQIVPLSISYQFDPCDQLKARELLARQQEATYQKQPGEDLRSLALGISGYKGKVHLHFGEPLREHFEDAEDVAHWCNHQIIKHYRLHPSNFTCWRLLREQSLDSEAMKDTMQNLALVFEVGEGDFYDAKMLQRLNDADPELRPLMIEMYANPVLSSIEYLV